MFTSWHNSNEIEKCVSLVSSFTTIRIFSENKISWGPSEGVWLRHSKANLWTLKTTKAADWRDTNTCIGHKTIEWKLKKKLQSCCYSTFHKTITKWWKDILRYNICATMLWSHLFSCQRSRASWNLACFWLEMSIWMTITLHFSGSEVVFFRVLSAMDCSISWTSVH